ncbi:D-serine deaminase, pyridoxal phosphate-dependent [Nakamurella panacisegetis]|uniref:D-serine deaminase, pyridoxal phosphate-dependent n=1 Tax=Nakamurella panacisegetis TaxID=1090615 RepID=A0A1H0HKS2_9ACTN|nr:alanine racemase [Nakamurella panacisegetis]SDO19799.1 D-serine deaminase, pyridoxal phosphate-dependent [Nakamurella panacisegetis]
MIPELAPLGAAVAALGDEVLDWRFKAAPAVADGYTVSEFLVSGARLSDFGTPLLTLDSRCVAGNIAAMASWCAERGLALAPHGKTTMAPALYLAQLEAGAWGITLANEPQVRVGRAFGLPRIHLANALLRPGALRWLAAEQAADPSFRFSSWVDSVRAVELMTDGLPPGASVDVCVELGVLGGRTGVRGLAAATAVAQAVARSPRLRLVGVSGYEGAVAHGTDAGQLSAVDAYLDDLAALHAAVSPLYDLTTAGRAMVTVGGSAYFDQVAARLAGLADPEGTTGPATEVVLRSGAYVIHDDGYYRSVTPSTRSDGPAFESAMHAFARVVSQPEPGLALLDAGRRDLPFDQGYPEPQLRLRPDAPSISVRGSSITGLNDQHAFMRVGTGDDVQVGDIIRLGLSHPCTAIDKWTLIPMLADTDADDPHVVGMIRTYF